MGGLTKTFLHITYLSLRAARTPVQMSFMSRKRHKIKESELQMTSAFTKSYKGEKRQNI
jgi:hypothetical protein